MKITFLFYRPGAEGKDPEREGTYDMAAVPRVGDTIEEDGFWDVTSVFWRATDSYVTIHCAFSEHQGA